MRRTSTVGGVLLASLLSASACVTKLPPPAQHDLSSFDVQISGVFVPGNPRTPLAVASKCINQYGGADKVPDSVKGSKECRFVIPRGEIEIDVDSSARALDGSAYTALNGPVSYRVVPGDLTGDYKNRWSQATNGTAHGTVKVAHVFGEVRVWTEDAPPELIYNGGTVGGTSSDLPPDAPHTFATGISLPVFFEEPTLAKIQIPDGLDNRSSPLVGQFITIGKTPESGEKLIQSCAPGEVNDGKEALMVVTGLDPGGFFVTDATACKAHEDSPQRIGEPSEGCVPGTDGKSHCAQSQAFCTTDTDCRYLPGTFGSVFVYNYNFPDGLYQGDALYTISGAIQEFTSTTQIVFPSWTIADKVRDNPDPSTWNKYLKLVTPKEISLRTCGLDANPFITDVLCGQNKANLKLESLESGLVFLRNVKFPDVFKNCDFNADQTVPFFCEATRLDPFGCVGAQACQVPTGFCDPAQRQCIADGQTFRDCAFCTQDTDCPVAGEVCINSSCVNPVSCDGGTDTCGYSNPEDTDTQDERLCYLACHGSRKATSPNSGQTWDFTNQVCSEGSNFDNFGQFVVEMAGPGKAEAGFDETVPGRIQQFAVGATSAQPPSGYSANAQVRVWCDQPVHYRFGNFQVVSNATDPLLPAKTSLEHVLTGAETTVGLIADGAAGTCWVSINTHTHINLVVQDAVPDLVVNCKLNDPDPARAASCKALHAARFDVTGHLRQVQPGRPRWIVLPRDVDDICCHPGKDENGNSLGCPTPIKACKQ